MTMLEITRDDYSAPFFDAAAQGTLLVRTCTACSHVSAPTARRCAACYSADVEWTPAGGQGRIITWSIPQVRGKDGGTEPAYVLAVVELAEGPWLHVQVLGDHSALAADADVTIEFTDAGGGEPLPVVRL